MKLRVDPKRATPVYRQLVEEVKAAIARGACRPGEMIPSVRDAATQSLVNPNTVAKAYRELEREGVVSTRRGLGVFVSDRAPALCRTGRRNEIEAKIESLAREAERAGMSPEELAAALERSYRKGNKDSRKGGARS